MPEAFEGFRLERAEITSCLRDRWRGGRGIAYNFMYLQLSLTRAASNYDLVADI